MEYNPVFVASTGRAGSSLMMKVLAAHPEILVRSFFPYEARSYQYGYVHNLKQQNIANSPNIKWDGAVYRLFQGKDRESIAWSKELGLEDGILSPQDLVTKYYQFLAQIEHKPQGKLFAEKLIGLPLVKKIITTINNYKIIFLKRDPRDTFFSIKSFNKKRGYLSFGEQQGDRELLNHLIGFYKVCERFKRELTPDNYIDIQYEKLITNKVAQIKQLYIQLGVSADEQEIMQAIEYAFAKSPESLKHITSKNISSSLCRWKEETDASTLDLFATYQDDLKQIGYE